MTDLDPSLEQRLADLSDVDWAALTARVRPPSSAAQLKEIAGRVLTGQQLDAFVSVADPKKFAAENGDVDESRVMGHLTAMFGAVPDGGPQYQDFGQHRPPPPQPGPGDRGKAEAAKRFGVGQNGEAPSARGGGGAAEAAKRFGKREG
jgi:hypothetical protein